MSQTNIVIAAAHAIRPHLKQLLKAEDAKVVAQQLDELLAQSEEENLVDNSILNLLGDYEATRNWIERFMNDKQAPSKDDDGSRGFYSPLAGNSQMPPGMEKYTCPDEKAGRVFSECHTCHYANGWARQSDESIPFCPAFDQPLKLRK